MFCGFSVASLHWLRPEKLSTLMLHCMLNLMNLIAFWNVSVIAGESLNGSGTTGTEAPQEYTTSFFRFSHECFVNNYFELFPQNVYVACMRPNGQGTASTDGANLKMLRYFNILQNNIDFEKKLYKWNTDKSCILLIKSCRVTFIYIL